MSSELEMASQAVRGNLLSTDSNQHTDSNGKARRVVDTKNPQENEMNVMYPTIFDSNSHC